MSIFMGFFAGLFVFWLVVMIIALVFIILSCIGHYKMFKMLHYAYPIAAWIPFWGSYAVPDLVVGEEESITLFGLKVPAMLFKMYWLISMFLLFVPVIGGMLGIALNGICLGTCYGYIYSALENKDYEDCKVLGMVSGFIPVIAIFKFLAMKREQ